MLLLVSPVRPSLTKAIWFPSGDHAGCASLTPWVVLVSCVSPLPSAFITQISRSVVASAPEVPAAKAIRLPSGDHEGSCSGTGVAVSCLRPLPSAFITEISLLVALVLWKAIREPSGDQTAWLSPTDVPGILVAVLAAVMV